MTWGFHRPGWGGVNTRLSPVVSGGRTRGDGDNLKSRKFHLNLFSHVVSQTLDEVACRVHGVFILGHIQRAPEGVPGPRALPDPALSRGLGLGGARGVCSLSDP